MQRALFVLMVVILGCRDGNSPPQPLTVAASVDRPVFRLGDTVIVTIDVSNPGTRTTTLETDFCPVLPFVVTTLAGVMVGPDFVTSGCLLIGGTVSLPPGAHRTFVTKWAGSALRDAPSNPVSLAPGEYLLRGRLRPDDVAGEGTPVLIEILPGQVAGVGT